MKFRKIKKYEDCYIVSNTGIVKSIDRIIKTKKGMRFQKGKVIKPYIDKDGYLKIGLHKNGICKNEFIHRLVAIAFIENPQNKRTVNHKDGNKQNNNVTNLEWATHQENNIHAIRMGLNIKKKQLKKVRQLDLAGNLIKIWNSMSEASRKTGINVSKICLCCQNKRNKTGGYSWQYEVFN